MYPCLLSADDFIGAMAHDVFFEFDKNLKSKSYRKYKTDEPETERYLSRQGKQIVPNFLMTTLKITFNNKC